MRSREHDFDEGGGGPRSRSGASAVSLLFWLVGAILFVVPFLRAPDASTVGEDPRRFDAGDIPFVEDVGDVQAELEFEFELAGLIAEASEVHFGLDSEDFIERGLVQARRIAPGRAVYAVECAGCHGTTGDGGGPAARFLDPRPRNFRRGIFKFTSTESGSKPLRSDLFRTITRGLSGASMPDFRLTSEERRWDLVEYVRYLSMLGEFEQLMLDEAYDTEEQPDAAEMAEIIYARWLPGNQRGVYPDAGETERDGDSVTRGRELFLDPGMTNCATCHGETGMGDGLTSDKYEDDWGYKIVPRNFQMGVFRAGDTPEDLWRSIATGINGTPMGAFGDNLTGEQIWDLVHFVQNLGEGGGAR